MKPNKIIVRICIAISIITVIALAVYHLLFGGLAGNNDDMLYIFFGVVIVGSLSGCILFDEK